MGNIITKKSDEDLLPYHNNMSVANLLATTDIISIAMYSPAEYRILKNRTNSRKNKENNTPQIIERGDSGPCSILKNSNSPFPVLPLNAINRETIEINYLQ